MVKTRKAYQLYLEGLRSEAHPQLIKLRVECSRLDRELVQAVCNRNPTFLVVHTLDTLLPKPKRRLPFENLDAVSSGSDDQLLSIVVGEIARVTEMITVVKGPLSTHAVVNAVYRLELTPAKQTLALQIAVYWTTCLLEWRRVRMHHRHIQKKLKRFRRRWLEKKPAPEDN